MALFLTLAISANCFAEGAAGRFNAEEKMADSLITALTGSGTYEQVSKSFSQGLLKNLNAANFAAAKDAVKKQVGTIKNINFVILNKQYDVQKGYNGIDELVYFGSVNKDKFARIFISFELENNVPKINGFQVTPLEASQNAPAAKK